MLISTLRFKHNVLGTHLNYTDCLGEWGVICAFFFLLLFFSFFVCVFFLRGCCYLFVWGFLGGGLFFVCLFIHLGTDSQSYLSAKISLNCHN